MRILLADDHGLVRAGLRALLAELSEVTEVHEAADGYEALAATAQYKPDIVLMDITMPRMNGFEATWRIHKEYPNTRVIVLSMHRHEEFVVKAFRAGASGYLVKSAAVDELHQALRVVAGGQTYVSPSVQAPSGEEKRDRSSDMTPLEQLSPRQREVLQLIAEGMSSRQIANMLGIKTKTVESHRTQLMHRLGIHDVAGLVRYAIRHGLVAVD